MPVCKHLFTLFQEVDNLAHLVLAASKVHHDKLFVLAEVVMPDYQLSTLRLDFPLEVVLKILDLLRLDPIWDFSNDYHVLVTIPEHRDSVLNHNELVVFEHLLHFIGQLVVFFNRNEDVYVVFITLSPVYLLVKGPDRFFPLLNVRECDLHDLFLKDRVFLIGKHDLFVLKH